MPRGIRGRGRGRGGRGRGRGRGGLIRRNQVAQSTENAQQDNQNLDINKDVKGFFVGTASTDLHYEAQEDNRMRYAAALCLMDELGIEMSQNARVRALATAIARGDRELINGFLSTESFGFVEVLKAMQLLDSGRQIRFYEKKMKRLQMQNAKVKTKTLGKLKSNIDNLTSNKPKHGSASGASCNYVREWSRRLTKENLEFFALHMPTEPWRKLADIVHFNPKNDFPNLPWFLPFCYGEPAPEGSIVHKCKGLSRENVSELVLDVDVPFSHIKQFKDQLSPEAKAAIARNSKKLDTVIWNYEDLMSPGVDKIILDRLTAGESVKLPYGKLMERLLTMKIYRENPKPRRSRWDDDESDSDEDKTPKDTVDESKAPFYKDLVAVAEKKLREISLPLEQPILVIGDMSSSMNVAIRTATIISSLLTAITSAKLVFFNGSNMDAPRSPSNVEEVLQMAIDIQASGCTAPAASLMPIYESKTVYKTIIMVTDEEENTACKSYRYAPLYKKYHDEVFPAKMVFVSFLRSQHAQGQMVNELRGLGFDPMQFVLDQQRPDLTKLDTLFGLLSSDTTSFEEQLKTKLEELERDGLFESFKKLSVMSVKSSLN